MARGSFDGVVYQIYPRSFRDTSGDGIGDLRGIVQGLDHLAWLGVDAVWLSPIYRSPMADFGYDVADHTDVDPVFGDLADMDALIADAHARGIEVWLDWVPNHTSDQHPWFLASRTSRDDPKRDHYIWRDPAPDGGPPNNWRHQFADDEPAWTFDEHTGQYYLHLFLPQQPDVNWANPQLRTAMHDVLRFWMDRGVDGFRADVIHLIGKDPALPDDPPHLVGVGRAGHHHLPEVTNEHLRGIRAVLDDHGGHVMIGEINLPDARKVAAYLGEDRLHLAFHFGLLEAPWDADAWRATIREVQASFDEVGASPTWVLGNHDQPRIATRYGREGAARAAAVALLTLRGPAFLFAGDELGLEDAEVADGSAVDPGGRDGVRAPLPWEASAGHGWAGDPWLPWPPDPAQRCVEVQRADPSSMLHLHRRLLALRRDSAALRSGSMELLDVHADVLGLRRWCEETDGDVGDASAPLDVDGEVDVLEPASDRRERLVLVSFVGEPRDVPLDGAWRVELASDRCGEGEAFTGRLEADQALVLVAH